MAVDFKLSDPDLFSGLLPSSAGGSVGGGSVGSRSYEWRWLPICERRCCGPPLEAVVRPSLGEEGLLLAGEQPCPFLGRWRWAGSVGCELAAAAGGRLKERRLGRVCRSKKIPAGGRKKEAEMMWYGLVLFCWVKAWSAGRVTKNDSGFGPTFGWGSFQPGVLLFWCGGRCKKNQNKK